MYLFFRRVCCIRIYNIDCAVMHPKVENNVGKKVQKHTQSKMAACLRRNSRWPLLCLNCIRHCRSTDVNIFRIHQELTEIRFVKYICHSRGNAPPQPHKFQRGGGYFCPLPNRSGRFQGTTPTTWLNFYTPCKSQPTSILLQITKISHTTLNM